MHLEFYYIKNLLQFFSRIFWAGDNASFVGLRANDLHYRPKNGKYAVDDISRNCIETTEINQLILYLNGIFGKYLRPSVRIMIGHPIIYNGLSIIASLTWDFRKNSLPFIPFTIEFQFQFFSINIPFLFIFKCHLVDIDSFRYLHPKITNINSWNIPAAISCNKYIFPLIFPSNLSLNAI